MTTGQDVLDSLRAAHDRFQSTAASMRSQGNTRGADSMDRHAEEFRIAIAKVHSVLKYPDDYPTTN